MNLRHNKCKREGVIWKCSGLSSRRTTDDHFRTEWQFGTTFPLQDIGNFYLGFSLSDFE